MISFISSLKVKISHIVCKKSRTSDGFTSSKSFTPTLEFLVFTFWPKIVIKGFSRLYSLNSFFLSL